MVLTLSLDKNCTYYSSLATRMRFTRFTFITSGRRLLKKCWVQSHFQTVSGVCIWFLPNIYPTFTKSFVKSLAVIIVLGTF